MSPLMLADIGADEIGFPCSQVSAYSPALEQQIFVGSCGNTVNMEWVLHQINFWKYHFTREEESALYTDLVGLEKDEFPQLWESQLSQDGSFSVGNKWKAIAAFLPAQDMKYVRVEDSKGREDVMDEFSGTDNGGAIQDFTFELCSHDNSPAMSDHFIRTLDMHMPPKRTKTRSCEKDDAPDTAPKTLRMENLDGGGKHGDWLGDAWLTPLPSQSGIPGWQSFKMMKYWRDDLHNIDGISLWAYEGVMLPGGKVLIGRWWSPDDNAGTYDEYSGPSIMWRVD